MVATPIVKMIQELVHTWGGVDQDADGHYVVPIYFECREDAEAFKVEMMMVASGQTDYEKQPPLPPL